MNPAFRRRPARLARLSFLVTCAAAFIIRAEAAPLAEIFFARATDAAPWKQWSPRDEIAPQFSFDATAGRDGRGALKITSRLASDFGAWRREIPGVRAGETYRFAAWYRTTGVVDERRSVIVRLQFLGTDGKPVKVNVRPPEYALDVAPENGWSKAETVVAAPEGAASLDVQLAFGFSAGGSVAWDAVRLAPEIAPRNRVVRAMTIHHRPRNTKSAAASVEQFCALVRDAAAKKPDIVCLPEGITVIGTGKTYVDVSEPIPGPTTERLGALAKELRTYIVAGIYERVAPVVYNTAVLIDRDGKVAGTYRKTHLPREEWESGLTPGDGYPVFQTDFGKIGLLVCWDLQFPEPWRALGLQGAEIILHPTWGGTAKLLPARAIENHAFVVVSSYDLKSGVFSPTGDVLAEATQPTEVLTADLHLDQKFYQRWLGDMSTRTWKERRGDLPWTKVDGGN